MSVYKLLDGVRTDNGVGEIGWHILVLMEWPKFLILGCGLLAQLSGGIKIGDVWRFIDYDGVCNDFYFDA